MLRWLLCAASLQTNVQFLRHILATLCRLGEAKLDTALTSAKMHALSSAALWAWTRIAAAAAELERAGNRGSFQSPRRLAVTRRYRAPF